MPDYRPTVTPQGQVSYFVPPDYGGITPASVEDYNAALVAKQQAKAMPPTTFGETVNLPGYAGAPGLTFDFAAEQAAAYEKLKPFYEKVIEFAQGDLNLAKRIIEYTYQSGMRETQEEYQASVRQQGIEFPGEQEQLQTEQNRRGIMEAGFGGTQRDRLKESQALRREAVDRALKNRESQLTSTRGFGLEEQQRGFQKNLFNTEREQRNEASGLAQSKFGIKSAQYQAELGKKMFEEQARIAKEAQGAFGGGGGGGGPVDYNALWKQRNPGTNSPRPVGWFG